MFARCVEKKPSDNIPARLNLASILYDLDRVEEAIIQYKAILEEDSSCMEALLKLGKLLVKQTKYEEALDTFKVILFLSLSIIYNAIV